VYNFKQLGQIAGTKRKVIYCTTKSSFEILRKSNFF